MEAAREYEKSVSGNGIFCTVQELFYEGRKSQGKSLHFRRSLSKRTGPRRSLIRGRGMEFFESREYVPQDEMRAIDWKVSARLNGLYTKIFVEERSRPVFLAVDQRKSMFFGSICCFKAVLAAKIAARLATAALHSGDHLGGLVFSDKGEGECAVSGRPKNLAHLFGLLAAASQQEQEGHNEQAGSWSHLLNKIANQNHVGSVVFLISDFFGLSDEHQSLLFRLRKRADIFALFVMDPLEQQLPDLGRVGMVFGRESVVFDSGSREFLRKYQECFKEKCALLSRLFLPLNIPLLQFSTACDLDLSLNQIFLGRF